GWFCGGGLLGDGLTPGGGLDWAVNGSVPKPTSTRTRARGRMTARIACSMENRGINPPLAGIPRHCGQTATELSQERQDCDRSAALTKASQVGLTSSHR